MFRRTFVSILLLPSLASARVPFVDYLPNLPAEPPAPFESDQEFLTRCRDEEAYVYTKHSGRFYSTDLWRAAQGESAALAAVLRVAPHHDGAAAEGYAETLFWLLHRVGDSAFAAALSKRSVRVRQRVVDLLDHAATYDYSARHPRTFKLGKHRPA